MNNFEELIANSTPTLVDFSATWCGPCKMMHPILEEVKQRVDGRARIIKIDVDEAQDLAMQYGIQSVPTLMIFKNGQLMWREVGVHMADDLVAAIDKFA